MIVVKFGKNLFHNGFTEKRGLRSDPEFVTILTYRSHLAVIQIDNLTMLPHKGRLLLLHILRIDSRPLYFPLSCHLKTQISPKLANYCEYHLIYSLGLTPNSFLKLMEKWDKVLKPVMSAVSEILYLPSARSWTARCSL